MFALVADVERYPDFLPWCVALRVVERRGDDDIEFITAEMIVAFTVFRERFKTLVRLDPKRRRIDVEHVDGPFRKLNNEWTFAGRSDGGSTVDFSIAFEFRNILLQATAKAMFESAFAKMSDAFVERAHAVYGDAA